MKIADFLTYVLNPLNPLRLLSKLTDSVQIKNNNINSTLQYILQKCNFIEDIILLVSAQLCIADLAFSSLLKAIEPGQRLFFMLPVNQPIDFGIMFEC